LLPAAMWLVLRMQGPVRGPVIAGLIAVNVGCLVLNALRISSFWFIWVAPATLFLYIVGARACFPAQAPHVPAPDEAVAVPA
jgi:hypothetical protein